ncbi:hypothetical protein [Marinicella meishanensis]|uniref:hypothetical protein n=1 Tax=Marinicella meishanensis TaxID=2873263 RepID=UPI001CBB9FEE|nr:hypothetical protein [Marinicella sp. NBU2979]
MQLKSPSTGALIALTLFSQTIWPHQETKHQPSAGAAIQATAGNTPLAAFDLVQAEITASDHWLTFTMQVSDQAGTSKPTPTGKLEGSEVFSYVWPTQINSAEVGFAADQGILSMAITSHPDFDDTPLFDENGDGNLNNDGTVWHSHWVVLVPDEACGPGALKVKDIPAGAQPQLPLTWPGLPILIDSPGYSPILTQQQVSVRVPYKQAKALKGVAFDGVTAGLRVNESAHAPLLCVVNVFDVASGDLSMPGRVR